MVITMIDTRPQTVASPFQAGVLTTMTEPAHLVTAVARTLAALPSLGVAEPVAGGRAISRPPVSPAERVLASRAIERPFVFSAQPAGSIRAG